jgi:hypothetical protein
MLLVSVRTGASRLLGTSSALPATMITAMVSPMARPIPRITAATSPDRAARKRTMVTVCQRVAPRAIEPSR